MKYNYIRCEYSFMKCFTKEINNIILFMKHFRKEYINNFIHEMFHERN